MNAPVFSGNLSEDSVYKSCEIIEPSFSGQFYCFITYCAVRHMIHIKKLVYTGTEKFPYHRFHLLCRNGGKLIQNIIQAYPVLQSSFAYPGNKGPFLFFQILIFLQGTSKYQMAVLAFFVDFQKDIQY